VVTRSCASSGSTRSPEGGIEMAQKVRPDNSFKPTPIRGGPRWLGSTGGSSQPGRDVDRPGPIAGDDGCASKAECGKVSPATWALVVPRLTSGARLAPRSRLVASPRGDSHAGDAPRVLQGSGVL